MNRSISLIAAISENGVIGRNNELPWSLPDDFKHFRKTTLGHCLVMGRRTFESIGSEPLDGRRNIVVSRRGLDHCPEGVIETDSVEKAIAQCGEEEIYIGGGEGIFAETLPLADRLVLTRVHAIVSGDTHFPEINFSAWDLESSRRHPADERNEYPFTIEIWNRRPQANPDDD